MKMARALAIVLMLAGSLTARSICSAPRPDIRLQPQSTKKKTGRWHMAENGHAVYCYGPVVILNLFAGGEPKRYATQCRGTASMVPLHD